MVWSVSNQEVFIIYVKQKKCCWEVTVKKSKNEKECMEIEYLIKDLCIEYIF